MRNYCAVHSFVIDQSQMLSSVRSYLRVLLRQLVFNRIAILTWYLTWCGCTIGVSSIIEVEKCDSKFQNWQPMDLAD